MSAVELSEGRLWVGQAQPRGSGGDRVLLAPDGLRRIGGSEDLLRWGDVDDLRVEGQPRPDGAGARLRRGVLGVLDGILEVAGQGGAGATDREPWRFVALTARRTTAGPWRAGPRAVGDAGTSADDLAALRTLLHGLVADSGAQVGLGDPDRCAAAADALRAGDASRALAALRG